MKKLILSLLLAGSLNVEAKMKNLVVFGMGYDKTSDTKIKLSEKESLSFRDPGKPSLSISYLGIENEKVMGITLTNNAGVLVNFGFEF